MIYLFRIIFTILIISQSSFVYALDRLKCETIIFSKLVQKAEQDTKEFLRKYNKECSVLKFPQITPDVFISITGKDQSIYFRSLKQKITLVRLSYVQFPETIQTLLTQYLFYFSQIDYLIQSYRTQRCKNEELKQEIVQNFNYHENIITIGLLKAIDKLSDDQFFDFSAKFHKTDNFTLAEQKDRQKEYYQIFNDLKKELNSNNLQICLDLEKEEELKKTDETINIQKNIEKTIYGITNLSKVSSSKKGLIGLSLQKKLLQSNFSLNYITDKPIINTSKLIQSLQTKLEEVILSTSLNINTDSNLLFPKKVRSKEKNSINPEKKAPLPMKEILTLFMNNSLQQNSQFSRKWLKEKNIEKELRYLREKLKKDHTELIILSKQVTGTRQYIFNHKLEKAYKIIELTNLNLKKGKNSICQICQKQSTSVQCSGC